MLKNKNNTMENMITKARAPEYTWDIPQPSRILLTGRYKNRGIPTDTKIPTNSTSPIRNPCRKPAIMKSNKPAAINRSSQFIESTIISTPVIFYDGFTDPNREPSLEQLEH